MNTSIKNHGDSFYRTLAGVAIGAPIFLVAAASQLPEGTERGEFMLFGLGTVFAVLVTSLALRLVYSLGFTKALKSAASQPNRSVTA